MKEQDLPPLMGFPQEEIYNGGWCIPFYSCVIGPFRIYVYTLWGEGLYWTLERCINDVHKNAASQFVGNDLMVRWQTNCCDPLTLMVLIKHVTSESNEEGNIDASAPTGAKATATTGADDGLHPLQV